MMSDPFFSSTAIQFGNQESTPTTFQLGNDYPYPPVEWVPPPKRARRIRLPRAKVDPRTFTSTVSWSNYFRVCQHDGCNRAIGFHGKSYHYGVAPGEPKRDVCRRCHMKFYRRLRAARLKKESA